ncbi:MAG: copper chaperone PCu(A)C [Casimicrobiaceae bacterium]
MEMTIRRLLRPLNSRLSCALLVSMASMVTAVHAAGTTISNVAGVTVEAPWMRLVIRDRPVAGYFTLHNDSGDAIVLTGVASSACGMLMLHQSTHENAVDKMFAVKSLTVPAHGKLSFAPGGYHLMCMSPGEDMVIGRSVPVTLQFADTRTLTVQFPVRGPTE